MNRVMIACVLAASSIVGCNDPNNNWFGNGGDFDVDRYVPQVTSASQLVTINLMQSKPLEDVETVHGVAATILGVLEDGGITLDPKLAQVQVKRIIEQHAPDIANDPVNMAILEAGVAVAVGHVQKLIDQYGSSIVDPNIVTVKLVAAAVRGVAGGTAILMPQPVGG